MIKIKTIYLGTTIEKGMVTFEVIKESSYSNFKNGFLEALEMKLDIYYDRKKDLYIFIYEKIGRNSFILTKICDFGSNYILFEKDILYICNQIVDEVRYQEKIESKVDSHNEH